MGAECSIHKDYDIEESPLYSPNKQWTLYSAIRKHDKAKVTVFVHTKSRSGDKSDGQGTDRASKNLKILRHPSILRYHKSFENSDGITMVTEPVCPLECVIDSLDAVEIISGLYDIVEALVFLHEKGFMSHNNVSLSSIYVGENHGSWRLGGMEHVSKFSEVTNEFLNSTRPYRDPKSVSPEEKANEVKLTAGTGHSLDAYAFGMLVSDILDSGADLGGAGEKFGETIQNLFLHESPKMRPILSSLLSDEFFKTNFVEVLKFLSNITIKSDMEKDKFFRSLSSSLRDIPPKVVSKRLLPQLLSRFVFAEPSAEKNLIPHLLMPRTADSEGSFLAGVSPVLPEELFRQECVPILTRLWTVRDCHVRLLLLRHFGLFANMFEKKVLEDFVLPQMLLGLRDSDDRIVAATFNALAVLVHILGGSVVVGGERRKNFFEGRPKFDSCLNEVEDSRTHNSMMNSLDKKMNSVGPSNLSSVIHIDNKVSRPLKETSPARRSEEDREKRKQDRERRRLELERKREERRREKEQRKSHRTVLQLNAIDAAPHREVFDDDEAFEPWDDVESAKSPRSEGSFVDSCRTTPDKSSSDAEHANSLILEDMDFKMSSSYSNAVNQNSRQDSEHSTLSSISTPRTSTNKLHLTSTKAVGKPLKLEGTKKTTTKGDNSKTVQGKKNQSQRQTSLGGEYEIKHPPASRSHEMDFFADMEPAVTFESFESRESIAASKYGSKLAMSQANLQMESGWSDEDW